MQTIPARRGATERQTRAAIGLFDKTIPRKSSVPGQARRKQEASSALRQSEEECHLLGKIISLQIRNLKDFRAYAPQSPRVAAPISFCYFFRVTPVTPS